MRRYHLLLILVLSISTFAGPARACSCAMLEPSQMLEFAPTAFVGTVTGVGNAEPAVRGGGGGTFYTFEVETVLAGEVPAEVNVSTAADSAGCGFEAAIGTRMAVFAADEGDGVLSSGLCSTTDPELAIKALGPGNPPSEGSASSPASTGFGFDWQAAWLGIGGVAIVGAIWLVGRRRG